MLQEMRITNFAIISELAISFEPKMTVLTGETGAGKSIIIDALALLTGARAYSDYVKTGAKKAILQALFTVDKKSAKLQEVLVNYSLEMPDNTIILQREITTSGKNICLVNGRMVNRTVLCEIGSLLVDLNGQNSTQELLDAKKHLNLLDKFGGVEISQLKMKYRTAYLKLKQLAAKVTHFLANEQEFRQHLDLLNFQKQEIQAADLQPDEEEKLLSERDNLLNYQKIFTALTNSLKAIAENENSPQDAIGLAMRELEQIENLTKDYRLISENVRNAYYLLEEASNDLHHKLDNLFYDEERLAEIEERLALIKNLKRKYGASIPEILAFYEKITVELTESDFSEEKSAKLQAKLIAEKEKVLSLGKVLRKKRQEVAQKLAKEIKRELRDLYMESASFEVVFKDLEKNFNEAGLDLVQFYIVTNVGQSPKPLVKVASGGELSRLMLALKTIFSKVTQIPTLVFDEIDSGVSGRVAQKIAEKMKTIAQNSQVLCITHLPQVASIANQHYLIEKTMQNNKTATNVKFLSKEERVQEVACMMSGYKITDSSKKAAEELLKSNI